MRVAARPPRFFEPGDGRPHSVPYLRLPLISHVLVDPHARDEQPTKFASFPRVAPSFAVRVLSTDEEGDVIVALKSMSENGNDAISARLDIEQRLREEFEAWLSRQIEEVEAFHRSKFEEKTLPALIEEAEEDLRDKFEEKLPDLIDEEAQTSWAHWQSLASAEGGESG